MTTFLSPYHRTVACRLQESGAVYWRRAAAAGSSCDSNRPQHDSKYFFPSTCPVGTGMYFCTKHTNSTPRLARSKPYVQLAVRGMAIAVYTANSDRAGMLLYLTYSRIKLSCPLHDGTRRSRGIAPPIFTHRTRIWVVSVKLRTLHPRENTPLPTEWSNPGGGGGDFPCNQHRVFSGSKVAEAWCRAPTSFQGRSWEQFGAILPPPVCTCISIVWSHLQLTAGPSSRAV